MRSWEEIEADSVDEPAFSNGFEWDAWSGHWCNRCVHDQDLDSGGCPLVAFAMSVECTPSEWVPGATDEQGRVSLTDRYGCLEFKPIPE